MSNVDSFGNTFDMWRYYTATPWRGEEEGGGGRTKAMDSVTEVPGVNCLQTAKNCSGEPENPRPDSWDFK